MTNKHMKRWSKLLVINEIQIQMRRHYFTPTSKANIKTDDNIKCCWTTQMNWTTLLYKTGRCIKCVQLHFRSIGQIFLIKLNLGQSHTFSVVLCPGILSQIPCPLIDNCLLLKVILLRLSHTLYFPNWSVLK